MRALLVALAVALLAACTKADLESAPAAVQTLDDTAIYYWASDLGDLMTLTFGDLAPPTAVQGNCTACHSVSRAGSRIGYSRCVAGNCAP